MSSTFRYRAYIAGWRFATGLIVWAIFSGLCTGSTFTVQAGTVALACALVARVTLLPRRPAGDRPIKKGGAHRA